MVCTGPINYVGMAAVQTDIENFKTALQDAQPQEAFIPAASPGILAQGGRIRNEYYPTTDGFLEALAQAMRQEYQASVQGKSGRARSRGDRHLDEADIILPRVSADFLASDSCYEVEMQRAPVRHKSGHACVIPIIVRSVDRSGAPFAALQALPKDAKAVASWKNTDEAWTDVARGIRHAADKLRKHRLPS
jgi:hypothetical protein